MPSKNSDQLSTGSAAAKCDSRAQALPGGGPVEADGVELRSPDAARLEVDQPLEPPVARAEDVRLTQDRLRGLLRANQMIASGLTLPVVLRRLVVAAHELVGARYAALGVIAADGGLTEFVHVGMSPAQVDRISHLPQGKGLLGAVIEEAAPIRLAALREDHWSAGFPPEHPP